jgi:hypothetical protein
MIERRAIQAVSEGNAFALHVAEELLDPIDAGVGIGAAVGAAFAISSRMIGGLERASLNECPFSTICGSEAASVVPAQFLPFPVGRLGDRRMSAVGRNRSSKNSFSPRSAPARFRNCGGWSPWALSSDMTPLSTIVGAGDGTEHGVRLQVMDGHGASSKCVGTGTFVNCPRIFADKSGGW